MAVLDKERFSLEIENHYSYNIDISMMDAVIAVCEQHGVELGLIKPLINRSIKEKVLKEARDLNFFPKEISLF